MQAIRVWLSALVALFLVVSMFHVPLIQMWKKQKASAVPVSTAPAAATESEPVVSPTEGDTPRGHGSFRGFRALRTIGGFGSRGRDRRCPHREDWDVPQHALQCGSLCRPNG